MPDPSKEIIKAAKAGDVSRVKKLRTVDGALINARDKDGSTPLHCATWKGQQAVVVVLLEAGADVNAHNSNDHWGTTPLHAAAHANQPAIAQFLIDYGADVNARDMNGQTPMHHTTCYFANRFFQDRDTPFDRMHSDGQSEFAQCHRNLRRGKPSSRGVFDSDGLFVCL